MALLSLIIGAPTPTKQYLHHQKRIKYTAEMVATRRSTRQTTSTVPTYNEESPPPTEEDVQKRNGKQSTRRKRAREDDEDDENDTSPPPSKKSVPSKSKLNSKASNSKSLPLTANTVPTISEQSSQSGHLICMLMY